MTTFWLMFIIILTFIWLWFFTPNLDLKRVSVAYGLLFAVCFFWQSCLGQPKIEFANNGIILASYAEPPYYIYAFIQGKDYPVYIRLPWTDDQEKEIVKQSQSKGTLQLIVKGGKIQSVPLIFSAKPSTY